MFKKRHTPSSLARELLAFQPLLLLFLFSLHQNTVQCQGRLSKHMSSEPPSPSRPSPSQSEYKDDPRKLIVSIVLGAVTGLFGSFLFALVVRFVVQYLNRTPILKGPVIFSPKIVPKTLQSALAKENCLLGSSPNGKYYKTVLDNGLTIAVKRLTPFESNSPEIRRKSVKRQIQIELELLASLRHRNLMSLRAYVREPDGISLVYDYVSTGSLADTLNRLRENELQLGWEVRLRIAVGVVKGLQYLHFTCVPQILHYNLKPTNVMLDAEFEPRLADYGLAKLLPNLDRGTSVNSPPECFHNCRYTDKSDIFSFGMILGVLLTGKDPTDPFFGEAASGGSLGCWLRHLQQAGEAREALDKSILGEEGEEDEDEMVMALRIAAACLSDMPADRPSSDELVHMLTQLHSF
ncbi:inactive leucine-rich repeat receptor-like protein kinase CORYNE isoform X2 [Gastrolobium bilobum]|uniref:inactive leucine-rich repeat receptor-like protein kinase CORYNE isoform X2 n=1 Tax=Gastrolobium bilobum TaxID=150636 RepID=UPI002AB1F955|nr:inactive leucine-rich repeat receptor-like protein kinase CORYNE isoform X2 [Gastrolobium bilobum]